MLRDLFNKFDFSGFWFLVSGFWFLVSGFWSSIFPVFWCFWFSAFLIFCFSAFLLFCFSAFLILILILILILNGCGRFWSSIFSINLIFLIFLIFWFSDFLGFWVWFWFWFWFSDFLGLILILIDCGRFALQPRAFAASRFLTADQLLAIDSPCATTSRLCLRDPLFFPTFGQPLISIRFVPSFPDQLSAIDSHCAFFSPALGRSIRIGSSFPSSWPAFGQLLAIDSHWAFFSQHLFGQLSAIDSHCAFFFPALGRSIRIGPSFFQHLFGRSIRIGPSFPSIYLANFCAFAILFFRAFVWRPIRLTLLIFFSGVALTRR